MSGGKPREAPSTKSGPSGRRPTNLPQTGETAMRIHLVFLLASLGLANLAIHGQDSVATTNGHRFACTDYNQGKVFIFSADGRIEWEYATGDELCYGLDVLPNGNVLYTTGSHAKEITPDKKVAFSYQRKQPAHYPIGFSACQRLANGNTLIADGAARRLFEIAPSGTIAKEVSLPQEKEIGGLRGVCQLGNGNYLVCHYSHPGRVREYDPQGKVLREMAVPGGATCAVRLPNGNTLISYKGAGVIEVNAEGKTIWECPKIKGTGLPTSLERLANGNTVITYWHTKGIGQAKNRLHVIEITPEGKIVWSFTDPSGVLGGLSIVRLLDGPGKAMGGELKGNPEKTKHEKHP
jgi:hypothetical protein